MSVPDFRNPSQVESMEFRVLVLMQVDTADDRACMFRNFGFVGLYSFQWFQVLGFSVSLNPEP